MFTLRAILLWCVHDFPAYAMLAGTTNKWYRACPVCGPDTHSRNSEPSSKVVYGGRHQTWLPHGHPFRFNTSVFPTQEVEDTHVPMSASNHIRWAFLRAKYARFGGCIGGEDKPTLCNGVKRLPTFILCRIGRYICINALACVSISEGLIVNVQALCIAGHARTTCA